ncbi:unnamed protein product [Nezara viridula]|uniref:Programmed cell death protein 4 n=1 Tax=Nezara viridula TaxID=85310 RepID=A0A9P0HEV2_NEZVI|nr:unnamed protein product [Nezara viridula]
MDPEMIDSIEMAPPPAVCSRTELSKSAENLAVDQRIKKKAKRLTRHLSKEGVPNGVHVIQTTRSWKNTRRPRNGYGRGLPKKGGAGGKGVWGKLGSELEEEDIDKNDPNYDSDSLEHGEIELATVIPEAPDEELRKSGEMIILEYYEHGESSEAAIAFDELNFHNKKHMIPQLAIEIALDHKPSHREMTSRLISDLYGQLIKQRDIANAFDRLLKDLPDLILDTPDAPTALGNFLARAIADDCVPPKLIEVLKEKAETDIAKQVLLRADTLLSMKHGLARLDNVWGVGGGLRPVKSLIRQMILLLQEYISSGDLKEATRCLLDLEVPHFHHELVYEAIVMTLEAISTTVEEQMCKFLKSLSAAIIITPDMMERGFLRVFEDMPDIILDVPLASTVLERFVDQCYKAGFISDELIKRMPMRGRKRFVSEGDGGRVKDHTVTFH